MKLTNFLHVTAKRPIQGSPEKIILAQTAPEDREEDDDYLKEYPPFLGAYIRQDVVETAIADVLKEVEVEYNNRYQLACDSEGVKRETPKTIFHHIHNDIRTKYGIKEGE